MSLREFKRRVRDKLNAADVGSLVAWARERPGEHLWVTTTICKQPMECCALCGVVRRRDDKNNPCKGIVRISLREGEA
jgi:hypothetical protein